MALHGREAELAAIDALIAAARDRRGGAAFVTGEPGIGKSALLAAARERAEAGGLCVLAGAGWEGGGAPAYWPWKQALRDAMPRAPDDADPTAAQFAVLDGIAEALLARAAQTPLLVLLDDLHAADLASCDALVRVARELPRAPVALVAAWRDADVSARPEAAQRLARACRAGTRLPLSRLTAEQLHGWVGGEAAKLHARTEGNPLFVVEALRGGSGDTLGAAIREHLALLRPEIADVLADLSVLGRDLDEPAASAVTGLALDALDAVLREARTAGVIVRWSFSHVLVRDELYARLPPSRRATLHRAAGDARLAVDRFDPRGAHHLLAAGDPRAVEIARAAAAHALDVFGFEVGADLYAAAARAAPGDGALLADLAEARIRAGQHPDGLRAADDAAALARRSGDAALLARAALIRSTELFTGRRDPGMIAVLEEALVALPAGDSPWRARLLGRLASALVPPVDPHDERPLRTTREALAMASRLGDDDTRLYVQRYVAHALGYNVGGAEGLAFADDTCALADRLRRPLEALEQRCFRIPVRLGEGDLAGADVAEAELSALLGRIGHPVYTWRVHAVRAMRATLAGEFTDVERHLALIREIAREHDLPRAAMTAGFAQIGLDHARRDPAAIGAQLDERLHFTAALGVSGACFAGWLLAAAGRHDEARARLASMPYLTPALVVTQMFADAAVLAGDRASAERAIQPMLLGARGYPIAVGPAGAIAFGPSAIAVGDLLLLLDRVDDAIDHHERGLALARTIGARPYVVHGAVGLARGLRRRDRAGDAARADALDAEAARIAALLGMPGPPAPARPMAGAPLPALARDGDRWRLRWGDRVHALPDVKGLRYLELLLAAPGREIHVAELIGDEAGPSDAGEVLDAAARRAYKARLDDLAATLADAEARHDLGRADRARAEIDALTEQLTAAVGLGGRARRAGSTTERARINVQRRIRDAIVKIGELDPALARYLEATVHTGTFCSFDGTLFRGE